MKLEDFSAPLENASEKKTQSTYDDIPINIIGKQDLISSKKANARPQDLLDVERLEL